MGVETSKGPYQSLHYLFFHACLYALTWKMALSNIEFTS